MNRVVMALLAASCWMPVWEPAMAHVTRPAFVGCPSEGMGGPVPAPPAPPVPVPALSPAAAARLAYYGSVGLAVLAPRGWHCVYSYGSGGAVLLVTPRTYAAGLVPGFGIIPGPAVELRFLNGMNSGRGDVARVDARLFPAARDYVRDVIAMGFEPARAFPRGPYPADTTVRRSPSRVDYTTPAYRVGMGTFNSRLRPGPEPIHGVATLVTDVPGVVLLNVRLPRSLEALTDVVLAKAWTGSS